MQVSSLSIKSFRNITELTVEFEADWTILFGENNSGKTNILDALYAALRINRTLRQGAFDLHDYHLSSKTSMSGDAGPIELVVSLSERIEDEWDDETIQDFTHVLAYDKDRKTNAVALKVVGIAGGDGREESYEWSFLAEDGSSRGSRKFITELNLLQRLRPFYQLSALRDANREFNARSTYFSPFVSDPAFDDAIRVELTQSLATINARVLESHEAFGALRDSIESGARVVTGSTEVAIEAVPTRLSELLAHTQVSMNAAGEAPLPIDRHGSGSQSMAVLSLFNAYVASKLASRFDRRSRAILTLEEPESHLHPSAIRQLWTMLKGLEAQLVVTTHSGDLLGELPLRCVRRVYRSGGRIYVRRVEIAKLSLAEQRQLEYGIQASRGELLLARGWILVEGRTEVVGLKKMAEAMSIDLHEASVRVVDCQQYGGPRPFIKLADQLGIAWHCLCDGDTTGKDNCKAATDQLDGRAAADYVTIYGVKNIEAFLCTLGFDDIYLKHTANEKRASITAAKGTTDYANQVAEALIDSRKERAIREVCEAIKRDRTKDPLPFRNLLQTVCSQAAK